MSYLHLFLIFLLTGCVFYTLFAELRYRELNKLLNRLDELYPLQLKIGDDLRTLVHAEVDPTPWILVACLQDELAGLYKEINLIDEKLKARHDFSAEQYFENINQLTYEKA